MTFEDQPTLTLPAACLTRRERRVEREQARPVRGVVGWLGYAVAVGVVIVGAAWMASAPEANGRHASRHPTASVVSAR